MPYKEIPDITEKQQKIIDLVCKFRFINRKQIQEIMGHKDSRRINAWLKDLVEKNFLGRFYSKRLLENTKPAIYFLHNNGIRWIQINGLIGLGYDDIELKDVKKFYQDKTASVTFRNHCILLCDIYLSILRLKNEWNYEYITKTELFIQYRFDKDLAEKRMCFPDIFIEKINQEGDTWITHMLEIIDPKVPRYALEYKIKQYITLHDHEDWQEIAGSDDAFPTIFLILPNIQKLGKLARFIQETLDCAFDVADITFSLTTYNEMQKHGFSGSNWKIIKETVYE